MSLGLFLFLVFLEKLNVCKVLRPRRLKQNGPEEEEEPPLRKCCCFAGKQNTWREGPREESEVKLRPKCLREGNNCMERGQNFWEL